MNWISWAIIAILAAASGIVAYCWRKGYIKADSAVRILATVYSAVVDAEQLYRGAVKAGPQKKAYVLAQLHSLGIKYADSVLGPLIDATVALLNAMGWEITGSVE